MSESTARQAVLRPAASSRVDRAPTCHCAAGTARGAGPSNQTLQAKPTVGRQDDPLEREADRAADRVLAGETVGALGSAAPKTQRKCATCEAAEKDTIRRQPIEEEEEELLQPKAEGADTIRRQPIEEEEELLQPKAEGADTIRRQPIEEEEELLQPKAEGADTIRRQPIEEEEELLQPKAEGADTIRRQPIEEEEELLQPKADAGGVRGFDAAAAAAAVESGGRPLSAAERGYFEPRFGRDFSAVRIHDDARAQSAASAINARAYTLRDHIAFSAGGGGSTGAEGRRLMAHELSHVVQQTQPAVRDGASGFRPAAPAGSLSPASTVIARDPPARPTSEDVWGFRVTRSMCGCRSENQAEIDWANQAIRIYRGCDLPAYTTGAQVQSCFNSTAYGPAPPPPPSGTTTPGGTVAVAPAATGSAACDRLIERGTRVHEIFHARQGDRIARSLSPAFLAEWSRLRGTPNRLNVLRPRFPVDAAAFDAQWNEARNWVAGEVESFTWERRFRTDAKRALSRIC